MFNKEPEDLKNKKTKVNSTISEMKNTLERINSRIKETEKWINELKDSMVEITAKERNKEKRMKRRVPKRPLRQH